jgi:putative aldouronate transport system substrate-binding protein
VEDLVEQDIIVDLYPYLDEYAPDYMATIREMGYEKDIVTDSGVSPCTYYISEGVCNTGMQIRKDLLDAAGLDVPVTYEDYDVVLAAFKNMGVEEPFAMDGTSTGGSDVYNAALGVQLYSHPIQGSGNDGFYQVDGEVKFGYLEDGFVEYMTQMADWYSKGYINPDYVTENENNNSEEFTARVTSGTIGVFTGGRSNIDTYNEEGQKNNADFNLVPIASPRKEAGQQIHLAPYRESSLTGGFFATGNCDIEALLKWHNYWYTEEGNMLSNYGVEGETYEMVDGEPVFTDMITNNPEGLTLTQTTYIYIGQMGVVDNAREDQLYSEMTVEAKQIWGENVDNDWKLPGSCSMTSEESEEYTSKFSDIQTVISEMLPKFVMGDEPIENLSAFQDKLRDMGIEDCIALWQSALDRYNER